VWGKFSAAEMDRRFAAARELMRREEVEGLLLFGNSGMNRHQQANIFYLSNHLDLHHNYLLAPLDESIEASLYTGLTNHVPNAREVSDIPIIQWGGYNPAATIAARLREVGLDRARLGFVGINGVFSLGMPYQHYLHLQEELPRLQLVDLTGAFTALRIVKSDEEIEWMRRAARVTDSAIRALVEQARPGLTEYELVAIVERACRDSGGLPHLTFLRSMQMDAPNGCLPSQNPGDRRLEAGDVLITEISGSFWGYSGQIHRPIFIEADPTPEWQHMFDVALDAYTAIAAAMRTGATEADVIRAASPIGEAGFEIYDDLIHGYGVDLGQPWIDRSCSAYWPAGQAPEPPEGRRIERNMAIVIQPNPITPDERMGLQLGAATVVTDEGAESLHEIPFAPLVTG
jgi:Xaa-Pro dipeptidase